MKYHVWNVDDFLHRVSLEKKDLAKNKKSLHGKWQIFVKEKRKEMPDHIFDMVGYRLMIYFQTDDKEIILVESYAIYDDRNDLVWKNQPSPNQDIKAKKLKNESL